MKRRSCTHWNYGYYGPIEKCMIDMECSPQCQKYERRSPYKRRNESTGLGAYIPPQYFNCQHKLVWKEKGKFLRACKVLPESLAFDTLGRCKPSCKKRDDVF